MKKISKKKSISNLILPSIRKLKAYHIDPISCGIKIDAMENPFPLPEEIREDICTAMNSVSLNRYPDPCASLLKKTIGEFWNIEQNQMIVGNGSDELIQAIMLAFGGPIAIPSPTFAMYEITAKALSLEVSKTPLNKDFSLNPDSLLKQARASKAKLIFLACPNNPTGNRFSDEAIVRILEKTRAAVILDEAYFSFSGKTLLSLLDNYPNLIILRTLSKIGLAGLRLGVALASEEILGHLNKVRLPYNINALSQATAIAALKHRGILNQQISKLISERERLYNALSSIEGIIAYPSEANFILFKTKKDAAFVYARLKQADILIKNMDRPGMLKNCLRVTVGTPEENDTFVTNMKKILS
ncbi:MAG: histidinol-phosphate transaminase [Nitrospirota bacterium]